MVIAPLTLRTSRGLHANLIVYDSARQSVSRFEPHGADGLASDKVDPKLDKRIRREFSRAGLPVAQYRGVDWMTRRGPQYRECCESSHGREKGFCHAWMLLFLHLRIGFVDLSEEELLAAIMRFSADELWDIVRGYASFLMSRLVAAGRMRASGGRRISGYKHFCNRYRKELQRHLSFGDVSRELGRRWRALPAHEKDMYNTAGGYE